MKCEAAGKIIIELPVVAGTTAKGRDFEKREYVLQTTDIYKKNLKFAIMSYDGPIIEHPSVGDSVKVRFTVEAYEVKGKWYNDVKAYMLEKLSSV